MIQLDTTSSKIQLITSAAGSIAAYASWVDLSGTTVTPGEAFSNISTAATTDIVAAPGASTSRKTKYLNIANSSLTVTNIITVQVTTGGTPSILYSASLGPGECACISAFGSWQHYDWNGSNYDNANLTLQGHGPGSTSNVLGKESLLPIAETHPRSVGGVAISNTLTSGTLYLHLIYLQAGQKVNAIGYYSASTAAGTPTNQIFGLYDSSLSLLASTDNDTTRAFPGASFKVLRLTSPYVVSVSGVYYVGFMMTATTMPTLVIPITGSGLIAQASPILCGSSTTGLTTSLPSTAAAITFVSNTNFYAVLY